MKTYKAYLNQGGGCDHTIGCGIVVVDLEATNYDDAMTELVLLIKEDYNPDSERDLESAELYEIEKVEDINVKEIYQWMEDQEERQQLIDKEVMDKVEFERLKSKFGN